MGIQRGFQVVARSFSVVSRGFSVASRTAPSSFCTLLIIVSVLSRGCSVVSPAPSAHRLVGEETQIAATTIAASRSLQTQF